MNKKIILIFALIIISICSYASAYECSLNCEWDGSAEPKFFYATAISEISDPDITNSHVSIESVGTYTHDLGCSAVLYDEYEDEYEEVAITTRISSTNNPQTGEVLVLCAKPVTGYTGQNTNMHAYPKDSCESKGAEVYLFAKAESSDCTLVDSGQVIYKVTPNSHLATAAETDTDYSYSWLIGITGGSNGGGDEVPEFSKAGMFVALILIVAISLVILNKRKK